MWKNPPFRLRNCMVWNDLWFLVHPYFFEILTSSGPKLCSVIGTNYSVMLREQLIPALKEKHCLEIMVFIQDRASPHIAKPVKKLLQDTWCGLSHKQRFQKCLVSTLTEPCNFQIFIWKVWFIENNMLLLLNWNLA